MDISEKAKEFAEAIKSTPEFSELRRARAVALKNGDLKAELDELSKRQMDLYTSKMQRKDKESVLSEIDEKFTRLSRMPDADSFFKALKKFNELTARVFKSINEYLEKGLK